LTLLSIKGKILKEQKSEILSKMDTHLS